MTQQRGGMLRANLIVATGTALSRLTGLGRVAALMYVIGQGPLADAYIVGNETPNMVYELLLGGVLSATLVPLFTAFLPVNGDAAETRRREEATNAIITVTVVGLVVLTLVAIVAAPAIFGLLTISEKGTSNPELFDRVGTQLTRIFLIQILFYGITALGTAFLNARRRYLAAAWSPVLSNLVVIVALLTLAGGDWQLGDAIGNDRLRLTLALGTTVGIATMAITLIVATKRAGLNFRPTFQPRHPAVRRLASMSMWTLGYVICNQVVIIFVRNLSAPGGGGATAYFNAYTFFVFPHGLLAVSIATTFVPELARAVQARNRGEFIHRASLGLRLTALFTIPAGVALFVLRQPVIGLLLQRGDFDAADTWVASRALAGLALGLVAFSMYLFTLRCFYAHHDTRTAFIINAGQCLMNIVFGVIFVRHWDLLGLGAAFALSYAIAGLWALHTLHYKVRGFPLREIFDSVARMVVAAALGGELAALIARAVGDNEGGAALLKLLASTVGGLVVYVGVLIVLKAPELTAARRIIRR